jgi:steroid 5-alpha reductase family enzyme
VVGFGTVVAVLGLMVETVADLHKWWVKQQYFDPDRSSPSSSSSSSVDSNPSILSSSSSSSASSSFTLTTRPMTATEPFVGPDGGLFRITRHPNYTGEIIYWTGNFIAGIPALILSQSICGGMASLLGWIGIFYVMMNATSSLEKKQAMKYGTQPAYIIWKRRVKGPLLPLLSNLGAANVS